MPPSRRGTGFVNLQTYLGLNQAGADSMGRGLGQDINRQGEQLLTGINSAAAAARAQAQAGVPGAGGTYSGPGSFETGALSAQVAEAQRAAMAAQDQTGRAELLAQKYGPNTWGGSQLDSALAGAGRGAGAIADASTGVGRLSQYLGSTAKSTNAAIDKARNTPAPAPTAPKPAPYVGGTKPTTPRDTRKRDDLEKYGRP